MDKKSLREQIINKRAGFDSNYVKNVSKRIFDAIKKMDIYKKSDVIMVYVSFMNEVNTHDFIIYALKEGKTVITPICNNENKTLMLAKTFEFPKGFKKTKYGILEIPKTKAVVVDIKDIDLIITPGLAFTSSGKRLGYGGGFYDRLLSEKRSDVLTVCSAYKEFVLNDLPTDEHDVGVDYLVTDEEIIKC